MARPALHPPRPLSGLDSALEVLREDGGRVSTPRRAVLTVLFAAEGPLSADYIAEHSEPPLDVASTYRNLEHLQNLGLVRHVHLGHGPGLYELHSDRPIEYAVCESCGKTSSFDPGRLDEARRLIEAATGIRARFSHFPLVGLCTECSSRLAQ